MHVEEIAELMSCRPAVTRVLSELRASPGTAGIAESTCIEVGGVPQRIDIRSRDVDAPLLLFVHGGPGAPESPTSWLYQSSWEEFFTVVQWDQRGCGRSLAADSGPAEGASFTIDRMVDDGEEVVDYLLARFGRRKLFLVGHSWGTVIGVGLARRCPERLHAYVGIGQVVDSLQNERVSYDFALRRATETGNDEALAELNAIAPYPPSLENFSMQAVLIERKWVNRFGGMVHGRPDAEHLERAKLLSPDYVDDELDRLEGAIASILDLLPQLLSFDIMAVERLECPVFVFAGRFDYATPSVLAEAWLSNLQSPLKKLVWFERSAHMLQYEEPGRLLMALVRDVLPLA